VHEEQAYHYDKQAASTPLRCLGISPWGYVRERHCLVTGVSHASLCLCVPIEPLAQATFDLSSPSPLAQLHFVYFPPTKSTTSTRFGQFGRRRRESICPLSC
ncbi:unnamed protein product, partial [Protopolystoma xenopodis]